MSGPAAPVRWVTQRCRAICLESHPISAGNCPWYPPCRKEAPDLQAASVETENVAQFVGITSKDYDPAPAEAFVRSFKITYPSIYDPTGKVLLAFAGELPPSAIPSTMIIDREGRLAVRVLSEVSKITLVDMINDVANGR